MYLSVTEIAQAVGIADRNVRLRAKSWDGGRKRAKGKGLEYPVSALPKDWQPLVLKYVGEKNELAVFDRGGYGACVDGFEPPVADPLRGVGDRPPIDHSPPVAARGTGVRVLHGGAARVDAGKRGDAKLTILREWQRFCEGKPRLQCSYDFAEAYSAGVVEVDLETRNLYPTVSRATLMLWQRALKDEGTIALDDRRGGSQGRHLAEGSEQANFALALLVNRPHLGTAQVMDAMRTRWGRSELPSYATLGRWITDQKRSEAFIAATAPDAWKGKFMVAFGSQSEGVNRPNQRWELDSTPADLLLVDGRYSLIGCIDVFSRRAKLLVSRVSKSEAIALLLRNCIQDWGVPETVKTDNGKDYTSRWVTRALADLKVQQDLCPPFQPWHKPHIERFFRSFSHDLLEFLPGFAGHNVADAQRLRDQQAFSERLFKKGGPVELGLDAAALQDWCDRWLVRYEAAPHGGLKDESPWQRWHTYRGEPLRIVNDPRALDLLLAPAPGGDGLRKVLKQGIKFDQAYFVAAELADRVGEQVLVRYDPSDMGRCFVFEPSGKFLCVAVCAERLGLNPQAIAQEAMARQRSKVSEGRKALKALARKVKPHEVADQILYEAATQQAKLTAFPLPTTTYDIPALAEAAQAVEALTVKPAQGPSVVERAELAREQRRLQAEEATGAKAQPALSLNAIVPRLIEEWRAGHEGDLTEREFVARTIDLAEGRGVALCYLSELEFRKFRQWVLAPRAIAN